VEDEVDSQVTDLPIPFKASLLYTIKLARLTSRGRSVYAPSRIRDAMLSSYTYPNPLL
jgi:hypothetical protein